jgi:hypothetical protein
MSQALIMRDRSIEVTETEKTAALKVFTQSIRGVDEKNHKRWWTFLRKVFSLEDGEIAEIGTRIPRSGPFHRFHMALEQAVFNGQDRFTDFEQFRNWIKIAAGLVVWVPGSKGGIVPLPKSISYAEMEEDEMREFHESMLSFFRGQHAAVFLWKHLDPDEAANMMHSILEGFSK